MVPARANNANDSLPWVSCAIGVTSGAGRRVNVPGRDRTGRRFDMAEVTCSIDGCERNH